MTETRWEKSLKKLDIGECHQYQRRLEKAVEESENPYWNNVSLELKNAVVKPINKSLAKNIVEEYEWLGCMPAVNKYYFGIFFGDICGGVVVFGPDYCENLGVWDKYDYTGKILLLSRGVCLHWTPKNTGSKLIMSAIKMLPENYEVITATTDHLAGEVGTIYQACNFHYVGSMREKEGKERSRFGVIIDGKLYGSRAIRAKYGTQKKDVILEHHPDAKFVKQKSKHRYFLFRGNKKTIKKHKKAMEHLIKPYPKR